MKLNGDEPAKKSKSLIFKSYAKSVKAPKIWKSEETSQLEGSKEDLYNEELVFIIKRFQYLAKKKQYSLVELVASKDQVQEIIRMIIMVVQLQKVWSLYC